MPRGRPTSLRVELTPADRAVLEAWWRSTTIAWGLAQRARTILLVADGRRIMDIAATVGTTRRYVYKWTARFLVHGVDGLWDLPRRRGRERKCLTCANPTTESRDTACGGRQRPWRPNATLLRHSLKRKMSM